MKLAEFTGEDARKIMDLWKIHLGMIYKHPYFTHPEFFSELVQDPSAWVTGRLEDRLGSRWSDDAKLFMYLRMGNLEIKCYVQTHTIMPQHKQEAERAE